MGLMVTADSDVDALRRHIGGDAAFPYVDFQEQQALSEALGRWELLRRYFEHPTHDRAATAAGAPGH